MSKKHSILYVDDEKSNLNIFKNTFRRRYNIFTAESGFEGLEILECNDIDLILTDQRMPEMNGVEFLKKVMVRHPKPNRILITGYTDFKALKDAVNEAKIYQYIQKPWDEEDIQLIIDSALEIFKLKEKNLLLLEKLKEKNIELININEKLIESDRLKLEFLNIISHEIRTPLNGLRGATEIFKMDMGSDKMKDYSESFHILESSTRRLEKFLLLAERITSLKARKYQLAIEPIHVRNVIEECIESLNKKLTDKNARIVFHVADHGLFYADKELLIVAVKEILDNAIKYSNPNSEVVLITEQNDKQLKITIKDKGEGFPEVVLTNLYKLFVTSNILTQQGKGLDLALVKLIMDAHNGEINVKNNASGGAQVDLTFINLEPELEISDEDIKD
jgi:signal transduction histidine kinase